MSSEPSSPPPVASQVPAIEATVPGGVDAARERGPVTLPRSLFLVLLVAVLVALAACGLLWQKLSNIQEQLARQSAESGSNAVEARGMARQAQELSREIAARQALADTRLSEVALQRAQIEELVQSMSRSRDENMLVDIEAGLRLAQQQAQATGTAEPLLAALRGADQRLERSGQPRLSRVRAAVSRDIERIRSSAVTDIPGLLSRLDDLARQVDEWPLANAVPHPVSGAMRPASAPSQPWWQRALGDVREEARGLVRVSRIDQPEAVLVAPDQAFFLRENIKLRLLNARLGLLSRQTEGARADVQAASAALQKYFDNGSRKTQAAAAQLQQVQSQLRVVELPRIDETLAVLATAAAGR